MVYHSMRFLIQVFIQAIWFHGWHKQLEGYVGASVPPKQDHRAPLTIFQRDIAWLDCRLMHMP